MRTALNDSGSFGLSKKFNKSFKAQSPYRESLLTFFTVFNQLNIQGQALQLFHQDVERLWQPWFQHVLALYDALVNASTAGHVVGLNSEELLLRVRRTVSFNGPDLLLSKTLTAELSFTTQRLLRNERVRTNGPSMDLLFNQVMEFKHVHNAHRHFVLERITGFTVKQYGLT